MAATTTAEPKTPPSDRRIAANRANAAKSTGPRTEAGKARSRANAVKHGLTGAGIALPNEDRAEVEAKFLAVQEELAPQTVVGGMLAYTVALSFVRLQRSARHEAATVGYKVRHAVAEYTETRRAAADTDLTWVGQEPSTYRRRLMCYPEGVDRLIERLREVRGEVRNRNVRWNFVHLECLEHPLGRRTTAIPRSRGVELSKALEHDASLLSDDDRAAIAASGLGVADWARPQMEAYIDAAIAELEAHRATLDPESIERDRAEAHERALFDASREAALARRYEGAALRNFYRALKEIRVVEAGQGVDDPDRSPALAAVENPSAAAGRALDLGDALTIPDPADDPAPPESRADPNPDPDHRPPLASFGLTAEEVSRQLNRPHYARPATPSHLPLPPLGTGKPVER